MAEPCNVVRGHRIHVLKDALRTALGDAGATVDEGASALISLLIDVCREKRHDDETDAKVSAAMRRLAARLNVHNLSWTLAYFDVEISGEEVRVA
jgi:hypothetical protein